MYRLEVWLVEAQHPAQLRRVSGGAKVVELVMEMGEDNRNMDK